MPLNCFILLIIRFFLIQSPDGELTSYGYTLTYPGGSSSNSGSNAIGSQLESTFTISGASVNDTVLLYYYYDTDLSGFRNFSYRYPILVPELTILWLV